ncbi:MAG: transglutaminase-like domain-containing protein [Oscillospiraceae bacterium]|nr:transglutaminase-like domain-containing protein [Oscillospiraceae bacterium]
MKVTSSLDLRTNNNYDRQVRKTQYKKQKNKRSPVKSVILSIFILTLLSGICFAGWFYWWTQYARFEYALQPVVVLSGQPVSAIDFIYPSETTGRISAAFTNLGFRPVPGAQSVSLTLSLGRRTLQATSGLFVLTPVTQLSHEYKEPAPELKPMDFISNIHTASGIAYDLRFVEEPLLLEEYDVGEHTLFLTLNGSPFEVQLDVADTTPPTATAIAVVINAGETAEPRQFLTDYYDASGIKSVEFVSMPNFLSDRDQIVEIEVTDNNGNSSIFNSELIVILNTEDPVIEGTDTIISRVNNPIIYLAGVTAFDDKGRALDVQVDSSGVDQFTVGEYTVLYYVVDATGNRSEVRETVFIIDVDIEAVYEEVDSVLDVILNDDMSQLEKVRAIHRWIQREIGYVNVGGGPPPTVYDAAYRALRQRGGNCFNYYALAEVMLTRAGIPNMLIERIPGTPTRHRWNLVNPDDLGWHHFDSVPAGLNLGVRAAFFTDSEAREFSERLQAERGRQDYFTYNPDLYPEIVQ